MNKPLTIEQLKALEVGEWVWLICIREGRHSDGFYVRKEGRAFNDTKFVYDHINCDDYEVDYYSNYGKTWLAYKNKEAAEGKDDEIRKEVAKEILQQLIEWNKRETPLIADIQELAEKYNVEVEE